MPGKDLFPIVEAAQKGTVVMYLLSDAGQKEMWPQIKPTLTKGKTLYFSHGFSIAFAKDSGASRARARRGGVCASSLVAIRRASSVRISRSVALVTSLSPASHTAGVVPPKDVDVILVAPKGSGYTLRTLFLEGRGLNSSVAVHQDASGKARERAFAIGAAVGSGYMYETTFQKEVFSDLAGERGVLMGAIQGLFAAQYEVLRANGHSPSEAFNETVEEATQSLYPLIGKNGMDWVYASEWPGSRVPMRRYRTACVTSSAYRPRFVVSRPNLSPSLLPAHPAHTRRLLYHGAARRAGLVEALP